MGPCNSYFDTRTRNNNNPSVNPYRWYVTLEQRKQLINVDIEHVNGDGDFEFVFLIASVSLSCSPVPPVLRLLFLLYQLE